MSDQMVSMIERYMDNAMTAAERAAFERRMAQEPELAGQVHQQRELDAAIRRVMPIPHESTAREMLAGLAAALGATTAQPASRSVVGRIGASHSTPLTKWLAAAAVVAICVGGGWFVWDQLRPPDLTVVVHAPMPPADYYRMKVNSGFKPSWKCENDAEFAGSFNTQFGQPLLPRPLPEGVAVGGIDYCNTLTPRTVGLLSSVNDQKVIVLVDKLVNDRPLDVPAASGLRLFRRQLGELVAYEVTPLDHSIVLDLLYVPEQMPPSPPTVPGGSDSSQSG